RLSRHLLNEARRIRPTHVFVPDYRTTLRNAPALLWLRVRGVHVILRLGNAPDPGRFYRWLWRCAIAPCTDTIVCNSAFTARELRQHAVGARKVRVIVNAAAPRPQPWSPNATRIAGRIVFIGQIIPEKGLDLLIDAVGLVRARGFDATLDVVGAMDGWEAPAYRGYRDAIRTRAARADVADAVNFLGWREDVPVILSRASLLCCPSRPEQREGFGLVVLEAKLSGVPSIVTT